MNCAAQQNDVVKVAYVNGWVSKDFSAEGTLSIPHFDKDKDLILKWGPVSHKINRFDCSGSHADLGCKLAGTRDNITIIIIFTLMAQK